MPIYFAETIICRQRNSIERFVETASRNLFAGPNSPWILWGAWCVTRKPLPPASACWMPWLATSCSQLDARRQRCPEFRNCRTISIRIYLHTYSILSIYLPVYPICLNHIPDFFLAALMQTSWSCKRSSKLFQADPFTWYWRVLKETSLEEPNQMLQGARIDPKVVVAPGDGVLHQQPGFNGRAGMEI